MSKEVRCVGCGKVIAGKAVRVAKGQLGDKGRFTEAEEFGLLHPVCFDELTESPEVLLRAPTRVRSGKK